MRIKVSDDAGYTAVDKQGNEYPNGITLENALIVAPKSINTPAETDKVVVMDSGSLSESDKARIVAAVKKANPENTLLNLPDTKITVEGSTVKDAKVKITYPHGSESVQVSVTKFAGDIRQINSADGDASGVDDITSTAPVGGRSLGNPEAARSFLDLAAEEDGIVYLANGDVVSGNLVGGDGGVRGDIVDAPSVPNDALDKSELSDFTVGAYPFGNVGEANNIDELDSKQSPEFVVSDDGTNDVVDVPNTPVNTRYDAKVFADLGKTDDAEGVTVGNLTEASFADVEGRVSPVFVKSDGGSRGEIFSAPEALNDATDFGDLKKTDTVDGQPLGNFGIAEELSWFEEPVFVTGTSGETGDYHETVTTKADGNDAKTEDDLAKVNTVDGFPVGNPDEARSLGDLDTTPTDVDDPYYPLGYEFVTGDGGVRGDIVDAPSVPNDALDKSELSDFTVGAYPFGNVGEANNIDELDSKQSPEFVVSDDGTNDVVDVPNTPVNTRYDAKVFADLGKTDDVEGVTVGNLTEASFADVEGRVSPVFVKSDGGSRGEIFSAPEALNDATDFGDLKKTDTVDGQPLGNFGIAEELSWFEEPVFVTGTSGETGDYHETVTTKADGNDAKTEDDLAKVNTVDGFPVGNPDEARSLGDLDTTPTDVDDPYYPLGYEFVTGDGGVRGDIVDAPSVPNDALDKSELSDFTVGAYPFGNVGEANNIDELDSKQSPEFVVSDDGTNDVVVSAMSDGMDAKSVDDLDDLNPLNLGHLEEEANINNLADGESFVTGDGGTVDVVVTDVPGAAVDFPTTENGSLFAGVLEYPELAGFKDFGTPVNAADTTDRPGSASVLPATDSGSSFTGVLEYPELAGFKDFGTPVNAADTTDRPGNASVLPATDLGSSFTGVLEYPELAGFKDFGTPVNAADTTDRPGSASVLPATDSGSSFAGVLEYPELAGFKDFGTPVNAADTTDRPGSASVLPATDSGSSFAGVLEYPELAGVRDFGLSADGSVDNADVSDKPEQPGMPVLDDSEGVLAENAGKLAQTGADSRSGLLGAAGLGLAGVLSVFGARKRRED
ncbi:LPXTG cell wall anchor domain-containing protein [Arcanobacterium hippocoleae]